MQKIIITLSLFMGLISLINGQCFDPETYDTPGTYSYTVPSTGTIKISASGGDGGGTPAGNGANIGGQFDVTAGDVLTIVVGQQGVTCDCDATTGAGGGGTAVILNSAEVLIVAGAGGGSGLGNSGKNAIGAVTTPPCVGGVDCEGLSSRGGGGGGFLSSAGLGNLSPPAGGGQAGTLSGGGTGGTPSSQGCQTGIGGDGWGSGGAAGCNSSGGGGGGYKGGRGASVSGGRGGWGGESYVNVGVNNGATASASQSSSTGDGLVLIECLNAVPPVPTMGEWALIILALIIMSLGVVTVMRWKAVSNLQTAGGNASMNLNTSSDIPFNKAAYFKMLPIVWLSLAIVFAVSVIGFGYEMTGADVPGSLIAGAVGAYLIHLIQQEK